MAYLFLVLRLVHIFGAIIWAGFSYYQFAFLVPAVQQAGPAGGAVMGRLLNSRLLQVMLIAPLLTVLAGLALFWFVSGGLSAAYFGSWQGILLSIGALAGIAAFFEGLMVTRPTTHKLRDLGNQMAGGPPSPEQAALMQALRERLSKAGTRGVIFLTVAVVGMVLGAR